MARPAYPLLYPSFVRNVAATSAPVAIHLIDTRGVVFATFERGAWQKPEETFFSITGFTPETYAPPGKRSLKRNVYGNVVGYVSGVRYRDFGCEWGPKGDFPADALAWLNATPFNHTNE